MGATKINKDGGVGVGGGGEASRSGKEECLKTQGLKQCHLIILALN